ncbi:TM221 protein, partial [Smithornis capensis]|nr:TM221 protein [Smithornis capensis]
TALLASGLVFHMSSVSAEANGAVPWWAGRVLHPLATVLATLCLLLNVSCFLLCLLHAYFSTELHGGLPGAERADLFLLDGRKVRHAAIGLFCCGITFYLTGKGSAPFTFYMLLEFRIGPGIASACILSAGIIVLFIVVTHTLLHVSRRSQQSPSKATHNLYENDSAPHGESSGSHGGAAPRPRPEIHRAFSFPVFLEHNSQL